MTGPSAAVDAVAARVEPYLDLVTAPFTLPGSRLLVLRAGEALTVRSAEYERPLSECGVVERFRVFGADGRPAAVSSVRPERIAFGATGVSLTFDGPDAISIGADGAWEIEFEIPASDGGAPDAGRWRIGLPSAETARWHTSAAHGVRVTRDATGSSDVVRVGFSAGGSIRIGTDDGVPTSHAAALDSTTRSWREWFARIPRVREDLADMTAFCWWVLGANTIRLRGRGVRAVVPSKIGYVGLWQWDAYFIAAGLRHGAPELAREQLDIAFAYPTPEGQLPDVVHEEGVLASSEDLPPQDRENLRRAGSAIADPDAAIPLTKPPLSAWALTRLEGLVDDPAWFDSAWGTVARSQEWWFRCSDLDDDGMPEYGHPYSSGLDDSPVFDAALPVSSPDLAAYLVVQDDLLAARARALGDSASATRYSLRADRTMTLLETMWNEEGGYYQSRGAGVPIPAETAVSLLPLLTGRLPAARVQAILLALSDPERFATPWPVPTVARNAAAYSSERMWRGPVWINVNALLVEGLRASGHPAEARELAERTLRLVQHAGGPHEYFNPLTGLKASRATTAFAWSAALYIDLAVGSSR
ncbi:hypothetical protein GCM10017714_18640 [Curtobacterium pusillum]|uniref:Glycogen debranching protein n=1 Tax=Curtobacterium pusillum TaxID=69373 RepID=A0ABX2MBE3_9MICO|nr:trehalase family glycosidase [Curtobacterium pusillum]NUU12649.1 glycogen debranching protein [Curtobacterium pusillum]GLK33086.1 hypothetical protein GCM10017610_33710 [Curtobacterium pusillum]